MVSTRQQRGKTRKPTEGTPPSAGSGDEYEEQTAEPRNTRGTKRAKATSGGKQQRKRRNKAKLSRLPDMPIDILYEIFSLLHPGDLMRISWTSKALNRFLTSKSSRHVWQAAFQMVPETEQPPPCLPEVTEMAYTNFLYSQFCMNCGNAEPLLHAWTACMKICGSCLEEIAVDLTDSWNDDAMAGINMSKVLPSFDIIYGRSGRRAKVLRSDIEQFSEEIAAAGKDSKETVIDKWESHVRERNEFADDLSDFVDELERLAEEAKENARAETLKRRIERIWEKLSEEGWHEEIATDKSEYEKDLLAIKGVRMIRPLGEKAWEELRGPLHEFMKRRSESVRARNEREQCKFRGDRIREIVESFRKSLPHPHDFHPSTADVCRIQDVRTIISNGTDEEFEACEEDIRSLIPELSATMLEERRQLFLTLLPQDSPNVEHLSLATTMFDCMGCRKFGLRIEEALSHQCAYHANYTARSVRYVHEDELGGFPWGPGTQFRYSKNLPALAREIVLECGEDPDYITTKEMNRKHHRFACFHLNGTPTWVTVLNWFEAFEHMRHHGDTLPCRFLRADELPEYVPDWETTRWNCFQCWAEGSNWEGSFKDVIAHLAQKHDIKNPTEDDYYSLRQNFTPKFKYRPPIDGT